MWLRASSFGCRPWSNGGGRGATAYWSSGPMGAHATPRAGSLPAVFDGPRRHQPDAFTGVMSAPLSMSNTARSLLPPLMAAISIVYPAGSQLSIAAGDAVRSSCRSLSVPLPGPITSRCSLPSSMFPFHSMSGATCLLPRSALVLAPPGRAHHVRQPFALLRAVQPLDSKPCAHGARRSVGAPCGGARSTFSSRGQQRQLAGADVPRAQSWGHDTLPYGEAERRAHQL